MKILGMGLPELVILMFLFAVPLVCCLVCIRIAGKKGYNAAWFGVMGWFLGLIGLLIAVLVPDRQADAPSQASELLAYKQLLDSGAISQEEFDAKKQSILGQ